MGHRRLEADTAACQGIDRRCGGLAVSVTPDVVGTKRIDRDEEYVQPARGLSQAGLRTSRAAGDSQREDHESEEEEAPAARATLRQAQGRPEQGRRTRREVAER